MPSLWALDCKWDSTMTQRGYRNESYHMGTLQRFTLCMNHFARQQGRSLPLVLYSTKLENVGRYAYVSTSLLFIPSVGLAPLWKLALQMQLSLACCVYSLLRFFLGDQKQRSATSCRGLAHSCCNIYIIPAIWGLSGAHSPCRWTSFSLQSTVEGQAGLLASAKSLQDGERHDDNDHRFFWSLQADVTAISQPAKP